MSFLDKTSEPRPIFLVKMKGRCLRDNQYKALINKEDTKCSGEETRKETTDPPSRPIMALILTSGKRRWK